MCVFSVVGGFEPARREPKKFLYVSDRRRVERRTIVHYTIVPRSVGVAVISPYRVSSYYPVFDFFLSFSLTMSY
jgi:hypothetical protein